MELFGILFVLAMLTVFVVFFLMASPRFAWIGIQALAPVTLVVLQLQIEGYRWPLTPAYLLMSELLLVSVMFRRRSSPIPRNLTRTAWILLIATVVAGTAFPVLEIPQPTGPFAVGTTVRHLVDQTRPETLASDVHEPRELIIQIWYPAESKTAKVPTRMLSSIIAFVKSHLGTQRTHAILGASLSSASGTYPVLIYSPSWHGGRAQNTFQVEELASHGFIVVGIDHPYSSAVTVFPDGRIVHAVLTDFLDFSSLDRLQSSIQNVKRQLEVRVEDVEFVSHELEKYNLPGSGDQFSGHLDFSRLGVFGYSFGGAAAAQACWLDPRFKAGMNMGGTMFGEVAEAGVQQPFLFMDDEMQPPTPQQLTGGTPEKQRYWNWVERDFRLERHSVEKYGGYRLSIIGTEHCDFSNPPSFPSIRYYLLDKGRMNTIRTMRIINAYTVAFFEKHLNHTRQPLLDAPSSDYPEAQFTYRPRSAGTPN